MVRLLLVDDDKRLLEVLATALRSSGYEVSTCEDGEQALQKLDTDAFQVVVLDLAMPRMNGYEVLRRIRANPRTVALPVIVLTGVQEPDGDSQAIDLEPDELLTKPVRLWELKSRVRAMATLHALRNEVGSLKDRASLRRVMAAFCIHALDPISELETYLRIQAENAKLEERPMAQAMSRHATRLFEFLHAISEYSGVALPPAEATTASDLLSLAGAQRGGDPLKHKAQVLVEVESELPPITVRKFSVALAMAEVVYNARRATPEGGTVTVRASRRNDNLVLEVIDRGPGIPPEVYKCLFEPYAFSGTTSSRGRSLGLPLVQSIVESHAGKLEIDTGPDRGTCVRLVLPITGSTPSP